MKELGILDFLESIPDPRNASGVRHRWSHILLFCLLASLCGYYSLNGIGHFIEANAGDLRLLLGLSRFKALPSRSTVYRSLEALDTTALRQAMAGWERQGKKPFAFLHLDGKALEGSIVAGNTHRERFQALVSLFASETGESFAALPYDNKEESEVRVAQAIIAQSNIEGKLLTADALHCQKKQQL